ncbi:hypothetical protein [Draconibacterium orientale]|uniref:hypothetical protein n=1 Tax=Draconibacterium orientale TaxID=1168034 RepID=UPI002ABE206E|nr:hypothetical protein [Draconibacterium orientale]
MASVETQSYRLIDQIRNLINFYSKGKYEFICNNSPDFIRQILNTSISKLLSIDVNNTFLILKSNQRSVYYFELRIIVYLRTNNFNIEELKSIVNEIYLSNNSGQYFHKVDLQLLEVLPSFKSYIGKNGQSDHPMPE